MNQQTIAALFPRLDDLVDIHATFLDRLLSVQSLSADKRIDSIGALLQRQVTHHSLHIVLYMGWRRKLNGLLRASLQDFHNVFTFGHGRVVSL